MASAIRHDDADRVRFAVSKVAAISGLHPYAAREELTTWFLDAVYQDEDVMDVDATTLGAHKPADVIDTLVGSSCASVRALGASLSLVLSERRDTNVEAVQATNTRLLQLTQAAVTCGTLDRTQQREINRVLRSSVNTDHGTRSEESAIALYERQTGRSVRDTNAHLLLWKWPHAARDNSAATLPPCQKLPLRERCASERRAPDRGSRVPLAVHASTAAVDGCGRSTAAEWRRQWHGESSAGCFGSFGGWMARRVSRIIFTPLLSAAPSTPRPVLLRGSGMHLVWSPTSA